MESSLLLITLIAQAYVKMLGSSFLPQFHRVCAELGRVGMDTEDIKGLKQESSCNEYLCGPW